MSPRDIHPQPANGRKRHHTSEQNRRLRIGDPPRERQEPGGYVSSDTENVYSRTMGHLRVCIRLLIALLLACVVHIVTDGVTPGLALGVALTTLLLLAALGLWRIGSRRKPDDTTPPGIERGE
jgi:hypothetical protein